MNPDTIFALASGRPPAAVAVIRVSGPAAGTALDRLTGTRRPPAREARLRTLRNPETGEYLDRALILWFPGPRNFTGEDALEFHLHGGRAVIEAVSRALTGVGLRPAEPGEFSRRAFLNGRMDLTAAEGIADLVAAETAAQRRQALRATEGHMAEQLDAWREEIKALLARWEAWVDFVDEDDVPESAPDPTAIMRLRDAVGAALADERAGERLRDGFRVAVLGPPNAGKSTLVNRLAGRDASIVTATAGTTRDVVEVHLDLDGYPVVVADTAGLRDAEEAIEAEGVRRARRTADAADLWLVVLDATDGARWPEELPEAEGTVLTVVNKADAAPGVWRVDGHNVSAATGEGMDAVVEALGARVATALAPGEVSGITRERHRAALRETHAALDRAAHGTVAELVAEDLRIAATTLGRITGRMDVEEILDRVFRDFCIGK